MRKCTNDKEGTGRGPKEMNQDTPTNDEVHPTDSSPSKGEHSSLPSCPNHVVQTRCRSDGPLMSWVWRKCWGAVAEICLTSVSSWETSSAAGFSVWGNLCSDIVKTKLCVKLKWWGSRELSWQATSGLDKRHGTFICPAHGRGYTIFSQTPRHWQPWNQDPWEAFPLSLPQSKVPRSVSSPSSLSLPSFPSQTSWSSPTGSEGINNSPKLPPGKLRELWETQVKMERKRTAVYRNDITQRKLFNMDTKNISKALNSKGVLEGRKDLCVQREGPLRFWYQVNCPVWLHDHGLVSPWGQILLTDSRSTLWADRNGNLGPNTSLRCKKLCHPEGTGLLVNSQTLRVISMCFKPNQSRICNLLSLNHPT